MSFLGILKFLFFAASGGIAFRQFVESNHTTQVAKIAGVIVFLVSVIFVIPDVMAFFKDNEASETERLYWESVEKHADKSLYCEYLEKYPDGLFVKIARKECPEQTAQPIAETPPPVAEPVIPEPAQPIAAAPVEEVPVSAPQATDDWQTIDRYQVKGGLVKDTVTGLMWMRCSLGQNWDGSTCAGEVAKYNWEQAMKTPNNFSYEGYSDWRVPTIEELKGLVDCNSGLSKTWDVAHNSCDGEYTKPTIKTDVFLNTPSSWFWLSSPNASSSGHEWIVNFNNGYNGDSGSKDDDYFVRLVRSGQ